MVDQNKIDCFLCQEQKTNTNGKLMKILNWKKERKVFQSDEFQYIY